MTKKKVNKSKKVIKSAIKTPTKSSIWKKAGAVIGIGLVSFAGAGLAVNTFQDDATVNVENVDTSNFVTKADLADTNIALAEVTDIVKATNEIVVENDVWEATAEALALDELEDRNYRDLRKELVDEADNLENVDYDEIEDFEVTVKNVEVTVKDVDDKDATVVFKLKVEYEDNSGDNINDYITATAIIEDGEVESLVFSNIN